MKRYEVFKKFKQFVQQKDTRSMDAICKSNGDEFKLQAQQLFLREYMNAYPKWRNILLYHEIGSGKTCTAITMAEEYLRLYPNNKVKVILPARLRTNFIDELVSPCGMEAYISKEDYDKFQASSTPASEKKRIKAKFTKALQEKYEIMSFEKFKITAMKNKHNMISWVDQFTKDSMIVVDEVHNLLSDKYDIKGAKMIWSSGHVEKSVKGMNTIIFRLLTTYAHPTCKMVLLTATPIFDNISQMKELVHCMNPNVHTISSKAKISDVIDYLRGKVSYFPGTSINAYPTVEYTTHEITLSKTQDEITQMIIDQHEDEEDSFKEEFMAKQRQVSLACLPKGKQIKTNIDEVLEDMQEYCPKILRLLKVIESSPGKHVVYSNFVQSGLKVVEHALKQAGWKSLTDVLHDVDQAQKQAFKVYAVWDGSIKDSDKQTIKGVANSLDNVHGEKVRVILGSPSVKEGVSFKHIQHMHLLDPVWNQSAKTQVEGRAIRYCSHIDITETHKPLRRNVTVNIYKSVPRKNGLVQETCDQVIYDTIIEKKKKLIKAGETSLKKVAIDHYLFRNMYSNVKHKSPQSPPDSSKSDIQLSNEDDVLLMHKKINKKRNSCPKKRRPDKETGECPNGMEAKKNKQGDMCCYKSKKTKTTKTTTCPKARQPINGNCPEGLYAKVNKHGETCCYKKTKSMLKAST